MWGRFRSFWPRLSGPGPQLQERKHFAKFLVESRLKFESFEPSIGFLQFLV